MKNKIGKIKYKFDMSPEAIDHWLRKLEQLYKLGMAIQQAKHIGKVNNHIQQKDVMKNQSPIT
jgi:hypothetical protein